jgi:hypothetical protein
LKLHEESACPDECRHLMHRLAEHEKELAVVTGREVVKNLPPLSLLGSGKISGSLVLSIRNSTSNCIINIKVNI